jgi:hypothetical protein
MKYKTRQIAAFIILALIVAGWTWYKYRKNVEQAWIPSTMVQTVGPVPVDARIEAVFSSGRGFRRYTILRLNYIYNEQKYVETIRISGYVEGRYKENDTIKRYIYPDRPEELIEK